MEPAAVEVVHVGSASRDVAADDPRGWRLGGGVTYASLTTARLGVPTAAIVGVDAEASTAHELDLLTAAGVALLRVPLVEGPVFLNVETPGGRVQTCVQVGVPLPIPEIPQTWRAAMGWSLVPVAGEIGDVWASVVPPQASLALAWQGLLRNLVAGQRVMPRDPAASVVLERADLVGVGSDDVAAEASIDGLAALLRRDAVLLLTEGIRGGEWLQFGSDGVRASIRYAAIQPDVEVDPTGAGDVVLAALHAAMMRPAITGWPDPDPAALLRFAAAAGSLVIEANGLGGVPDRSAVLIRAARA